MRNKALKALAIILCGLLSVPALAVADTTLKYDIGAGGSSHEGAVYVHGDRVRVETRASMWTLYVQPENTLYMIDPAKKEYRKLDEAAIKQLKARIDALRPRLREQLKKLPPDQRKVMEQRLGGILADPDKMPPLEIHDLGKTARVQGYQCEQKSVTRSGHVLQTLCVAPIDELHVTQGELDTLKAMFQLVSEVASAAGAGGGQMPYINRLDGVPVATASANGAVTQSLSAVSHQTLQDDLFQVPNGFTRVETHHPGTNNAQ